MYIFRIKDLPLCDEFHFGGKADSLKKLIAAGLPVPWGYGIAAEAFENGVLCREAENELEQLVKKLPANCSYAVRSSAVGEDGASDSFAGAYETLLDVKAEDIAVAVKKVAESSENERSDIYAGERRIEKGGMAVVIQRFIAAEFAGVLFTADPMSGSRSFMTGNYVHGAGEKLVSGEGQDGGFRIDAVKYRYDGNSEFEKYAQTLFKYAAKAERVFGCPLDIEWAVSGGKVSILQARPITSIYRNNVDEFRINDSLCGELMLSKTNVGEIFLRPVSPVTYSILCVITDKLGIPLIANVCGQLYLDISGLCSMIVSFGAPKERAFKIIEELAGGIPDNVEIPVYPFDKKAFLKKIMGLLGGMFKKKDKHFGDDFKDHIVQTGSEISVKLRKASSCNELAQLWKSECEPYINETLSAIATGLSLGSLFATREKLVKICGSETADVLLSNSSVDGNIESLGALLAVDDVINGRMSSEDYVSRYGHRHENEMELSMPYPYENPDFPQNVIDEYIASGINAYEMKAAQEKKYADAVKSFKAKYPSKSAWLDRALKKYAVAVYKRERVRSEALRLFCIIREYLLRAGQLTGLGEDIFMLYIKEVQAYLSGESSVEKFIPIRKKVWGEQCAMPAFPSVICGRFTCDEWMKSGSPHGFYRFGADCGDEDGEIIHGVAGSCGQAEGRVRVISSVDEADKLEKGEILVVPAANIGWIRVFPKAAAVITDIGAPLSHAVIVARELGIPAVVSCQYASGVLETGDIVKVDGTAGKVTVIKKSAKSIDI